MEELLSQFAEIAEGIFVLMLIISALIGGAISIFDLARMFGKEDARQRMKEAWINFARWLLISLQFALAADLVATAVSPSWDEIGQLAAIAAIRILLGYFLERDIEAMTEAMEAKKGAGEAA